jgi:hypothetical protein
MRFFKDLGRVVEQRWREKNYSEELFPRIAGQALTEADAAGNVDPWEVIRCLQEGLDLPAQQEQDFGDIPITVYTAPRFRIDVYYWLDGTTSVHEHSFSGAFQVLLGSSLHSLYSFDDAREVNAQFSVGRLGLKGVERLERGDVRRILPGGEFIHSLFHLDRPSATIAVRTHQTPRALPQYCYLKPHLAFNPFYKELLSIKKIQSVRMLLRMGHPRAYSLIGEMVSTADLQTVFETLAAAFEHLVEQAQRPRPPGPEGEASPQDEWEQFNGLLEAAHRRHGEFVNLLPPVLAEMQRESALVDLRAQVTGREHRFFLALLLNLPHRALVLDMIRQRFPDQEPVETVCRWVSELSAIQNVGSPELGVLGAGGFGDEREFLLRRLLAGDSIERVRELMAADAPAWGDERRDAVETLYRLFHGSLLMKSLLAGPPETPRAGADTAVSAGC